MTSKFALFLTAALLLAPALRAEQGKRGHEGHMKDHTMLKEGDLTWGKGPASLPPGAMAAVLEGDPTKEGPFTMRLRLPANYRIAPHWHPADEHVTVLSGSFSMGTGDKFDPAKATQLSPGGFAVMPAEFRHFAFTGDKETVIQLHGMGPWAINYINPKDDPRKQKARK